MGFLRFAASTPFAMVVTVLVFILMYALIDKPEQQQTEMAEETVISIPPEETPPPPDEQAQEPQKLLPAPPTTISAPQTPPAFPQNPIVTKPTDFEGLGGKRLAVVIEPRAGVPLITPAPTYPASCAARGTEGKVTVSFDVIGSGDVINVEAIDSTDRCFERAAIRAMEMWKFSPDLKRPEAIILQDQQQTFSFTLEDE